MNFALRNDLERVLTSRAMPEVQVVPGPETGAPYEPMRLLFPSPIGSLGLEICNQVVTSLVIGPDRKQRSLYLPLHDLDDSETLDELFGRLAEYLAGARRKLEIDWDLGRTDLGSFERRVLRETAKIPFGKTRTYGAIAEAAGRPEAYRQVLSILLLNPIPILIPCHRVVPNKSGIGSYIAGEKKKRWLLDLESQAPDEG